MLFHLDFRVEYPSDMTQKELFSIWVEEARVALEARRSGAIIGLWKCVGQRRVIAIADVDSPDTLDRILMDLPIMTEHGQHVQVQVTSLRAYEDFAADIKSRLESEA